jgi:hypothetical protein
MAPVKKRVEKEGCKKEMITVEIKNALCHTIVSTQIVFIITSKGIYY